MHRTRVGHIQGEAASFRRLMACVQNLSRVVIKHYSCNSCKAGVEARKQARRQIDKDFLKYLGRLRAESSHREACCHQRRLLLRLHANQVADHCFNAHIVSFIGSSTLRWTVRVPRNDFQQHAKLRVGGVQ
eukprot:3425504-Pleurochrysis_carterae.AAC.1